jgi:hypothetical protein
MRLQDATALVNFKRQPFRPIKYIYKTPLKELKKVL